MKSAAKAVLAGIAATLALSSVPAMGQTRPEVYGSGPDAIIWKNSTGLCWRTGYWTPQLAAQDKDAGCACDKDLLPKEVCEPPKVVQAPPPPPPVPAPAKLLPKKIDFAADALFDFDKYVLKPKGIEMLDELASTLSGATYESISAMGHTDPIGTEKYNQGLSERRADAVKTYLTGKGIASEKIKAEGRGESELKVPLADCKGSKGRKALIECLQPNRRVEVSVSATKEQ